MNIHIVTITGADDRTRIEDLVDLSIRFPFVEWGVLLSRNQGRLGYPTKDKVLDMLSADLRVALHICGGVANDLVRRSTCDWLQEIPVHRFSRIQVNLFPRSISKALADLDWLRVLQGASCMIGGRVQVGPSQVAALRANSIGVLFDSSAGTGRRPETWPPALPGVECGYAGGLTIENLAECLSHIDKIAGDASIWIDVQSGVMSTGTLDLRKVRRFLVLAEAWVARSI